MPSLIVTPLAAGILGLVFLWLSVRVIRFRQRDAVGIGHGDSNDLLRAIRVHGNFAEYVGLSLVMLALLEVSGIAPAWLLWGLGGVLVVSRLAHAVGLSASSGESVGRFAGTLLSLVYLLIAGGALVFVGMHNVLVG